nr:hypothetical protein [Nisaea nitritireducens]
MSYHNFHQGAARAELSRNRSDVHAPYMNLMPCFLFLLPVQPRHSAQTIGKGSEDDIAVPPGEQLTRIFFSPQEIIFGGRGKRCWIPGQRFPSQGKERSFVALAERTDRKGCFPS